eukprot:TRINITY_DN14128_c0_g3_i2.p1 TRINITY_DN14128_c0_g3~~TRINITY_DN14128_c0_g3_i2.p1  ORF type:complete len:631 (+),score=113.70 TRINITY_DN14128_c0_g3_i2:38-1894(+)
MAATASGGHALAIAVLCLTCHRAQAGDARSLRASGWNTFGPIQAPAPPPPPPPLQPQPELQPNAQLSSSAALPRYLVILLIVVFVYLAVYGLLRFRLEAGSPHRQTADRLLWCWSDLYTGKACCFWNVVFSPILLPMHAVRIYIPSCLFFYYWRVYWFLGGCWSSFFTDEEFPPAASSLGKVGGDSANAKSGKSEAEIAWVRAMHFSRKPGAKPSHPSLNDTNMCLFEGKIEAQDILQGALGDCWLLAAMATMAEHEGLINSVFKTYMVDPRGKYHVRLYDLQEKKWKVITVDDFVPCRADKQDPDGVKRDKNGMPMAMYAQPHGREIWVMMLEKAMAKLCGGYAAIEAGITEWGIAAMTGGSAWRYELTDSNEWERTDLVAEDDPKDKRACGFRQTGEKHDEQEFFDLLRFYHRHGAVLCCGGVKPAGEKQGLVPKHAFSLLQVRTVNVSWHSDEFLRMVQVRNPWGTGEWKGPWSDSSPLWEKYPSVKKSLNFSNRDDGTYWMQWEDFCKYWGYIGCVDCNQSIMSMRPPLLPESELCGPFKACLTGCCTFWCLCAGPRHYFVSHEASNESIPATTFRTTWGCDPHGAYCRLCEREMVHISRDELVKNGRTLSQTK